MSWKRYPSLSSPSLEFLWLSGNGSLFESEGYNLYTVRGKPSTEHWVQHVTFSPTPPLAVGLFYHSLKDRLAPFWMLLLFEALFLVNN